MRTKAVIAAALGLAACTVTRNPVLHPANEAARALGPVQAVLVGHGNLSGTIEMTLPTGEPLSG